MSDELRICVIGAGRIGLPISVSLAVKGIKVVSLELDSRRCKEINNSEAPFFEEGMDEALSEAVDNGMLFATDDYSIIAGCNVIISAIGTEISEDGVPDVSSVDSMVAAISPHLRAGDLFLLKTTLPIGSTSQIGIKLSKASNLELDEELFVAFSPERIVEGRAMEELRTLPKIVGGVGAKSSIRACQIMEIFGGRVIEVSDSSTAELCKLIDNSYRMTRFGFSADVAAVSWRNGIDAYEAINAANQDYPRNDVPLPSVGVSGYCLTKDPYYLSAASPEVWSSRGFESTWITARKAGDWQVQEAKDRVLDFFENDPKGKKAIIAGATYKEEVDDIRMSHGIELARMLGDSGMDVEFWDPIFSGTEIGGIAVHCDSGCIRGADIVIFTVPHSEFIKWASKPHGLELMNRQVIFDGWGIIGDDFPETCKVMGTGKP